SEVQSENRKVIMMFDEVKSPVKKKESLTTRFKSVKKGDKIRMENINFLNNSAVVVAKSKPVLYDLLCALEENPDLKIEIQGHICCQEKVDVNNVSTSRAKAVYNFLVRNKINRKRLTY